MMGIDKKIDLLIQACEHVVRDDRVAVLMQSAIAAADHEDIDAAVELAKKARSLSPRHSDPAVLLGLLSYAKGHMVAATSHFRQAVEQDPNNALPLWFLARDELCRGRPAEALAFLNRAKDCEPLDSYAVSTLVWLLNLIGNDKEAKSALHSYLSSNQVVCQVLTLILEFQEAQLDDNVLGVLYGKCPQCLVDLRCVAHSAGHDQRMLKLMICKSGSSLSSEDSSVPNGGCIHLADPALDSYRSRFGQKAVEHYADQFFWCILAPEIKRVFHRHGLGKQRPAKEAKEVPPEMVLVPGGEYTVGCTAPDMQYPERKCNIPAFLIDRYPVTNKQWREFDPNHSFPKEFENHPVTNVDFVQATLYARSMGKRLPTEVEWEAAARGPQGFRFPWGQMPDPGRANCADHKPTSVSPVTKYPRGASPCGALDMLGNALEWVDEQSATGKGLPAQRIAKGGGFTARSTDLACWLRTFYPVLSKQTYIGFRCTKDL